MKGVLKKQGQVVGSDLGGLWTPFRWRERYFEERDDKLHYYKKQGDSQSKGFIDLKDIVKVEPHVDTFSLTNNYGFDIITPTRTYHLRASSEVEQIAWINALNKKAKQKERYVVDKDEWISQMRSARRSVVVTVENKSSRKLVRHHYKLHGAGQIWKQFPPETIEPGGIVQFGNCSSTLISGAAASVTYIPEGATKDSGELWFRWRNPYRKITVSKESLFDVPKQFAVVADQDLSESHTILIMNQDLLKIKYTIHDAGTGSGTSSNANRAAMDAVDDNNMDEGENQTESESSVATSAEAHATRQKTLYHTEEWITKLRQALRSTLIIIENNTDFELHRSQWDLNRGIWRMIPPEKIAPQTRIMFGTESSGLGFDVGTFGRIIYTASSDKEAGGVFTLNWTNTFLFGISHQIGITSTSTQNGDVVADMEEKKDSAAAEVTFRIFQNKAQAEQAQEAVEPPNSSQQQVKSPVARRAQRVIVQEDGVINKKSREFLECRQKYSVAKKKELDRVESRLDMVCYQALSYLKEHQDLASSFLNLFRDEPEIEFSVEMESHDGVKVCPVTGLAFKSAKEKVNCWICGLVVHVSCVTYQPFPARYNDDLTTLKDKPKGLKVCTSCQGVMKRAESRSEWKSTRDRAHNSDIVGYERKLVKGRTDVAQACTEFSRLVATMSPEASTMGLRVEILFKEIQEAKEDVAKLQLWKGSETQRTFVENLLRSVDEFIEASWEEFQASKKTLKSRDEEQKNSH